jgi:hypothetical protein
MIHIGPPLLSVLTRMGACAIITACDSLAPIAFAQRLYFAAGGKADQRLPCNSLSAAGSSSTGLPHDHPGPSARLTRLVPAYHAYSQSRRVHQGCAGRPRATLADVERARSPCNLWSGQRPPVRCWVTMQAEGEQLHPMLALMIRIWWSNPDVLQRVPAGQPSRLLQGSCPRGGARSLLLALTQTVPLSLEVE